MVIEYKVSIIVVVPSMFKFPLMLTSFKYDVLPTFKTPIIDVLPFKFVNPDTFKLVTLKLDKSIDDILVVAL